MDTIRKYIMDIIEKLRMLEYHNSYKLWDYVNSVERYIKNPKVKLELNKRLGGYCGVDYEALKQAGRFLGFLENYITKSDCPICFRIYGSDKKYCEKCGVKLQYIFPNDPRYFKCGKCNSKYDSQEIPDFCGICGTNLKVFSKKFKPNYISGYNNSSKSKIFFCHSSLDKEFVIQLCTILKDKGFKLWLDLWEMKLGDSLIQKIQEGIESSDYLAIVLSPNSVNSKWVKRELNAALINELNSEDIKVLPILLKNCDIPLFLRDRLYADFRDQFEKGLEQFLNGF